MAAKVHTAVIGVGYFGAFHAEKYARLERSDLVAVADIDRERAEAVARRLATTPVTDYRDLIGRVEAVSVVVPTPAHFEVARDFLKSGVHVLVEKPITDELEQADTLIRLARAKNLALQVGHLERFGAARMAVDDYITAPLFIACDRIAPFKPRGTDVNVILDLMIHDIELIQNIVNHPVDRVDAIGAPVFSPQEDIANARIRFTNGSVANVTASRIGMKNERKMRIFQPDAYISVDFIGKKLTVARKGKGFARPRIPAIQVEERSFEEVDELEKEVEAFLEAVVSRRPPLVTGEDGRRALETAMLINQSLRWRAEAAGRESPDAAPEDAATAP
ncbi:MAG: Gfo/Idh/MocA family oxidoreductase [Alphaproteobacteria bacterium]